MKIRVFENEPVFLNTETMRVECINASCKKCPFSKISMPCRLLAAKYIIENWKERIQTLINLYVGELNEKDKN